MVCGCGRHDWLCFLCWVSAWAGCLCFWVLGLSLVVPAAFRATSGRAVGFPGLWVFAIEGAGVGCAPGGEGSLLAVPSLPPPGYHSSGDAEKIN